MGKQFTLVFMKVCYVNNISSASTRRLRLDLNDTFGNYSMLVRISIHVVTCNAHATQYTEL